MPEDATRGASQRFVVALLAVFGVLTGLVFWPFASYVILGLLLAYAASPVHRAVERRLQRRHVSALVTVVLVVTLILTPLVYISFALVGDALEITNNLDTDTVQSKVDEVRFRLNLILRPESAPYDDGKVTLTDKLVVILTPQARQFFGNFFFAVVHFITRLAIGLFITAFVVYYALIDGPRILDYLKSVIPLSPVSKEHIFGEVRRTVDGVFLGQIGASVIQGAVGGLGFLLFGIPNPVFWALVMIILSILPFLGAFMVWAPAGLALLLFGDTTNGVGLLLWGGVLVSNIDNFVKPKLIGHHAKMHPALVLVGVVGGLFVFGFIGFVLGPLVVSVFMAVLNVWRDEYVRYHAAEPAAAGAPPVLPAPGAPGAAPPPSGSPAWQAPDRPEGSASDRPAPPVASSAGPGAGGVPRP